jgi:hypothetical protein
VQDHFGDALDEKHDVPLLVGVPPQRVILGFIDKQAAHPIFRPRSFRDARRMNVKTFRGLREHSRVRPLSRPKSDPLETIIATNEFAEDAAMPLMIIASEKLDARNQTSRFPPRSIGGREHRLRFRCQPISPRKIAARNPHHQHLPRSAVSPAKLSHVKKSARYC